MYIIYGVNESNSIIQSMRQVTMLMRRYTNFPFPDTYPIAYYKFFLLAENLMIFS